MIIFYNGNDAIISVTLFTKLFLFFPNIQKIVVINQKKKNTLISDKFKWVGNQPN